MGYSSWDRKESGTTEMTEHSSTARTEVTRRHLQLRIKELKV